MRNDDDVLDPLKFTDSSGVRSIFRSAALRTALQDVINAANANSEPIHYKVREAIDRARIVLQETE